MRATRTVTMTTTATTMKTEAEIREAGDTVAVGGGGGKCKRGHKRRRKYFVVHGNIILLFTDVIEYSAV